MPVRPTVAAASLAAGLLLALTACAGPASSPTASGSAGAAKTTTASSASAASTGAPTGSAAGSGSGSGKITFTGTFTGTITIDNCDAGVTTLDVHFDGHSPDSSGAFTSHFFGLNGPNSEQFIASPLSQRPTIMGKTHTVKNFTLAAGKEKITANGSVTCP